MSRMSVLRDHNRARGSGQAAPGLRGPWAWCCSATGYFTRHGWIPLVALFLALGGLWSFLELADDVQEGDTTRLDEWVFNNVAGRYSHLKPFWQEVGRDLTALGGSTVITLIVASVTIFLLLRRQWRSAAFLVVAVVGGLLISLALKSYFDRPRPELFQHRSHVMTPSFPSGHSANAAVAYLTLAILLTKLVESPRMKALWRRLPGSTRSRFLAVPMRSRGRPRRPSST